MLYKIMKEGLFVSPASKSQQKAVAKYMKNNYDVFQIRMSKGKKEQIKKVADKYKMSVNSFINSVIDEKLHEAGIEPIGKKNEEQKDEKTN